MKISEILTIAVAAISIVTSAVGWLTFLSKKIKAISKGLQAMLRSQMLDLWDRYNALGYATVAAKNNFENLWNSYHSLGANGVMNGVHADFMNLPTKHTSETED